MVSEHDRSFGDTEVFLEKTLGVDDGRRTEVLT